MFENMKLKKEVDNALAYISDLRTKYEDVDGAEEFLELLDEEEEAIKISFFQGSLTSERLKGVCEFIEMNEQEFKAKETPGAAPSKEANVPVSRGSSPANEVESDSSSSDPMNRFSFHKNKPQTDSVTDTVSTGSGTPSEEENDSSSSDPMKRFSGLKNITRQHNTECRVIEVDHDDDSGSTTSSYLSANIYSGVNSYSGFNIDLPGYGSYGITNNQKSEEPALSNPVKAFSVFVNLPTNIPKNMFGKLKLGDSKGEEVASRVNGAIERNINTMKRVNPKVSFFMFDSYYSREAYGWGKLDIKVRQPATIDEKGDAWFYVDVRFNKEVDKDNVPDEIMKEIASIIWKSYTDYSLTVIDAPYDGVSWYLKIDFKKLEDLDFLRSCIR